MSSGDTIEVKVRKGQSVDVALRILKKRMFREGIMQEVRDRKYFVSPSEQIRKAKRSRRYLSQIIQAYDSFEHGEITSQEFEELGFGKPYSQRK